ncbi:MAG: DMT family transporter [Cytophagales bacterium]|nr:DMT family transporter [Cytophagales bacterium]
MATQFDPNKRIFGIAYAATAALFWGFLAILIKITLNDVSPVVVVWFRFGIAFSLLSSYFLKKDRKKFQILGKPPLILIIAALGLTINYIAFANGIDLTSPGNGQIFIQIGPILLAVIGVIIFKERLSKRQIFGFVVAGAGLIFFYRDQLQNLLGEEDVYIAGVLWLVLAAVAWTVFASLQKQLVKSFHAQQLNLVIFGLPMIILTPFVDFSAFANFTSGLWVLLAFLGINTMVAYGCLTEAFKYLEANKISVIITLNPIITFVAMSILGSMELNWIDAEVITVFGVSGAVLVITGAIMVILPKKINRPIRSGV